ncbi:MAG: S8 family peptidase [Pleurocapsa sp.]
MANQFEHLQLPKTDIQFTQRSKGFGRGKQRSNRSSHGRQLLNQVSGILDRPPKQYTPFGINPKLIFKIKLAEKSDLNDAQITNSGLNLLAKESKKQNAIVVFSSDDELAIFKDKLESYSGIKEDSPEYAYLDAIEEIVPLEPVDRIGRLLELEPLESQKLAALDLELWHTGDVSEMRTYIDNLDEFLKDWSEYPGMEVTDKYIGEYLCLVRIKVRPEIVEILLAEDEVKEIDRRPKPTFESPREINIPISNFAETELPPHTNCGVLVIDSGVQRGHPLIANTLGDTEVFPDPQHQFISGDANDGDTKYGGHGTAVAGIAIYGDVDQSLRNKLFQPQVWLFSARVTNQNNEYDPDLLLENQLEKAVNYFVNNYSNCKVINISLGDDRLVYRDGQKQFKLAAKIDEIAYKLQHKNILFVVSAGNYYYEPEGVQSDDLIRQDYPSYLLGEKARIIEPATAALVLTVGSLSLGTGSCKFPEDANRNAITKIEGYPSSFTRTGFGVDGMIKPDLVDFGGDWILDKRKVVKNDIGTTILTLNKNFQGSSLFRGCCGTSFSAPRVSNLAAQLFTKFPDATPNLIRALIANLAQLPSEIPDQFNYTKKNDKAENKIKPLQIYGYGQPNYDVAAYSTDNYVVLQEEGSIPVGEFTLYEIPPLPDEFLNTKGDRKISVTLAFDPPTRHTRGDSYLGVTMEFSLFRNIDADNLKNAFVKASKNDNAENLIEISLKDLKKQFKSITVDLFPGTNLRKKGTLQKGEIKISSKNWKYDGKPMYVVVACNRKWAREDDVDSQRYALVVSISHSNAEVNLYNQLQAQVQNKISQRVRIR